MWISDICFALWIFLSFHFFYVSFEMIQQDYTEQNCPQNLFRGRLLKSVLKILLYLAYSCKVLTFILTTIQS